MSHHLTPPAKRKRRVTFTPEVITLLAGLAVMAVLFGVALAVMVATEPTHQMRRVYVTTPAQPVKGMPPVGR